MTDRRYDYPELLANLKGEIARRELPMQRVAELSGMSQPTFSRRMNGSDFTVRELLHVCNVLGVSLEDLTRPLVSNFSQEALDSTLVQGVEGSEGATLARLPREGVDVTRQYHAYGNVVRLPSPRRPMVERPDCAPVIPLRRSA